MAETVIKAPHLTKKEYEKYRGRHVALLKDKVTADGHTSTEALNKALRKNPKLKPQQIELFYIQTE